MTRAEPPVRPRLLVLAPLRIEARALSARAQPGTVVLRTGAGPARATATARKLAESPHPDAVVVAGVAGALTADLRPGSVVVADRVIDQHGSQVVNLESAGLIAAALRRRSVPAVVGTVATSDQIVQGRGRTDLAAKGAVAVDMESSALLGVPWSAATAVVRAIADTPGRELRSLSTFSGGFKALAALRAATPVLEEWAGAVGPRRVILAGPRSFCAGVERAIHTVEKAIERYGTPVYVRRQIVHNRHVVEDLECRGAVFVQELEEVPDGATVVFSAHGVSPQVRAQADSKSLQVVDATCPLVAKVHREVRRFHERGYQVVLIGHDGHDETEGTLGEADGITLVEERSDIDGLDVRDPEKIAYITQTTLSPDDVTEMVDALSGRFPSVVGPSSADICYATQNRQDAVRSIAGDCDLTLVIGSPNSSNTARLVEVAARAGCRAVMIDDETEIDLRWLTGVATVGVTAGASAPPALVERVVSSLQGLAGPNRLEIEERSVRTENVNFPLPLEVR
ncbi:MAG TPA: 4-hydroxy-3-methylbut-2-enyl diphosphate reductase [Acidimicrobiales bacterium]|nr:4-hydroxy-3-methylbut-2-enyl diphosphate reductase [Acidimicrobiales bacterium]